jgi:NitT/TauT family transport system permease protein
MIPDHRGLWTIAGFAIVLVGWQLVVTIGQYPEIVLPSPIAVAAELVSKRALMWEHTLFTLYEIAAGFILSILIGVPIAFAVAFSPWLSKLIMPALIVTNSIPKVAIAPLLLLWFGFGAKTNIVLAISVAIFPIVINTALGLGQINPDLLKLGRIMGGDRIRIFWHIRLPAGLPSIFAGLKLGITLATIGVIVGEMIAGQRGIGYLSQYAASQLLTVMAFACIVSMSLLGVVLFYLIVLLEVLLVGGTARRAT